MTKKNCKIIDAVYTHTDKHRAKYKANGITLIALIITIIIMLILLAVTVSVAFGENGLIARAKNAGEEWNKKQQEEYDYLNNIDVDNLIGRNAGGNQGENPPPEEPPSGPKIDGDDYAEENYTKKDGDSEITVPKDFTVVDPDTGSPIPGDEWDDYLTEENIDKGIVIKDRAGNEFVWVPVPDPDKMYFMNGTQQVGKLYATETGDTFDQNLTGQTYNTTSGLREPANLTDTTNGDASSTNVATIKSILTVFGKTYGATNALVLEEWLKLQQEDFDNMIASVEKYKGFYCGRYETTGFTLAKVTIQKNKGSTGTAVDNVINPTWYIAYQKQKEMYQIGSVRSTMIWGCAWDQVMLWMKDVKNTGNSSKYYIKDSTGMGNYDATGRILTGSNESYKVKNIYDLAGNVWEWTMEATNTFRRGGRRMLLHIHRLNRSGKLPSRGIAVGS